jgi:hypothetical protein
MLPGIIQHANDLRHIAVLFQIPAKYPDQAVRQTVRAPKRSGQGQRKRKEKSKRLDAKKRIVSVMDKSIPFPAIQALHPPPQRDDIR